MKYKFKQGYIYKNIPTYDTEKLSKRGTRGIMKIYKSMLKRSKFINKLKRGI